jgi:uncharacterized protein YcaQ
MVHTAVHAVSEERVVMGERRGEPRRVLPLRELVRERVDATGLTLREFARRRPAAKYGTLQRYYNLEEPLKNGLRQDTMRQLALALDVPLSMVQQASDKSVERLYAEGDESGAVIIAALGELDAKTRAKVTKQVLELLSSYRTGPA